MLGVTFPVGDECASMAACKRERCCAMIEVKSLFLIQRVECWVFVCTGAPAVPAKHTSTGIC